MTGFSPKTQSRNEKFLAYTKYKKYQKMHQKILDKAYKIDELFALSIPELSSSYTKIETIYAMRLDFKEKFLSNEQKDGGHEKYLVFLKNAMHNYKYVITKKIQMSEDVYDCRNTKVRRITGQHDKQYSQVSEHILEQVPEKIPEQVQEQVEISNSNTCSLQQGPLNLIDENSSTLVRLPQEKSELVKDIHWETEVEKLIKHNEYKRQCIYHMLSLAKVFFSTYYIPNITEEQTIDIIQYFLICFVSATDKSILKIPRARRLIKYATTFVEYAVFLKKRAVIKGILKILYGLKDSLTKSFLENIIYVACVTKEYWIVEIKMKTSCIALIPSTEDEIVIEKILNKEYLAINSDYKFTLIKISNV